MISGIVNNINGIVLYPCGTSFHIVLPASYLLESYTKIITTFYIAREFSYIDSGMKPTD